MSKVWKRERERERERERKRERGVQHLNWVWAMSGLLGNLSTVWTDLLLLPTVLPSLFIRFSLLGAPCETLLDYNDKFMPITLIAARDLADWECYLGRWQLVLALITVCPARLGWDLTRLCTTQFRLWDVNWLEWASLVMSYCCTDKGDELW